MDQARDKTSPSRTKSTYPWKAMAFLMVTSATLSYGSAGLMAVLELYFATFLFKATLRGRMRSKRIDRLSTTCFNVYVALQQISALIAGFLADLFLGNYKTQLLSCLFSSAGGGLLLYATWQILPFVGGSHLGSSTAVPAVAAANFSNSTTMHLLDLDLGLASVALLLLAIGSGLSTVQSVFIGNQFTDDQENEKKRAFGWYYLFQNVGSLFSESGAPILRQTFGFFVCFATISGNVVASALSFLAGSFWYRNIPPVYGCCKCKEDDDDEKATLLTEKHTVQRKNTIGMRLKTKLKDYKGVATVFLPLIIYWALFFQQNSVWVLQGQRMNCYFGDLHIPPDLMPGFSDLLVVLFIPMMEYIVYPHVEKALNVKIRSLHKIFAGMMIAVISFILAGLLELYLKVPIVDCRGDVNLAWQVPQYIALSIAEVLVSVTGLEFAYSQAPDNSKNFATALWFLSQALGTAVMAGLAEIPFPRKAEFFIYSGLMTSVIVVSFFLNRNFKYRN